MLVIQRGRLKATNGGKLPNLGGFGVKRASLPATNFKGVIMNIYQRLFNKSHEENGCIVWDGALRDGYGLVSYKNKIITVHRLRWILTYGEIPDGQQVLHKCDNRKCFKIEHLFLGTQADNLNDAVSKGHLNLSECGVKRSKGAKRNNIGQYVA